MKAKPVNRLKAILEDNPALASREICYRCDQPIADAEYLVDAEGQPRHFCCPSPGELLRLELKQVISDLRRCAAQNEKDGKADGILGGPALAVSREQNRMILTLSALIRRHT